MTLAGVPRPHPSCCGPSPRLCPFPTVLSRLNSTSLIAPGYTGAFVYPYSPFLCHVDLKRSPGFVLFFQAGLYWGTAIACQFQSDSVGGLGLAQPTGVGLNPKARAQDCKAGGSHSHRAKNSSLNPVFLILLMIAPGQAGRGASPPVFVV